MMTTDTSTSLHTGTAQSTQRFLNWEVACRAEQTSDVMKRLLSRFEPISLADMDKVALLNRTDTKFVMRVDDLLAAVPHLSGSYRVLDIDGRRLNHYQTLYFDTSDLAAYRHHHNGRRKRYKVRFREYVDSRLVYLEIKCKNNKNRTVKSRQRTAAMATVLDRTSCAFIQSQYPYDVQELKPSLWNNFTRITLVSKRRLERLTLDIHLQFGSGRASSALPGVAIAEVKQQGFSMQSDFIHQMRTLGVRPTGFSKYCIGLAVIYPGLKHNRLKPKLRIVDRLKKGELNYVLPH